MEIQQILLALEKLVALDVATGIALGQGLERFLAVALLPAEQC